MASQFFYQSCSHAPVDPSVIVGETVQIVSEIDKNVDKSGMIAASEDRGLIQKKN